MMLRGARACWLMVMAMGALASCDPTPVPVAATGAAEAKQIEQAFEASVQKEQDTLKNQRPLEVVRAALAHQAAAVVLCHNHPSGDPTPSGAPEAEPFRPPDASSGGARSREEARAQAERAAGQPLAAPAGGAASPSRARAGLRGMDAPQDPLAGRRRGSPRVVGPVRGGHRGALVGPLMVAVCGRRERAAGRETLCRVRHTALS